MCFERAIFVQKKIGHPNSVAKKISQKFFSTLSSLFTFTVILIKDVTLESGVEPLLVVIILLEKVLARDGNSSVQNVTPSK